MIKLYILKYNKLIFIIYGILCSIFFNVFSPMTLCAEEIIEDTIEESNINNTNYVYYGCLFLGGIILISGIYCVSAYYFPNIDYFCLFAHENATALIEAQTKIKELELSLEYYKDAYNAMLESNKYYHVEIKALKTNMQNLEFHCRLLNEENIQLKYQLDNQE